MTRLSVIPSPVPLARPVLSATAPNSNEIDLVAMVSRADVVNWQFEFSPTGTGQWTAFNKQLPAALDHNGLSPGQTVFYRVKAFFRTGAVSGYSAIVSAKTVATIASFIKWPFGHFMGSNNINGDTVSGNGRNQNEMNLCAAAGPLIRGWAGIYLWSHFQSAKNVYDFAPLVSDFNYLQSVKPGAFFAPMIWAETFSGTNPTGMGVPAYILGDSQYGPGQDGAHFGYWTLDFGNGISGGTGAVWRPLVNSEYAAMFEALAKTPLTATTGPYAGQTFTFDTHPLIAFVHDQESSLSLSAGSDYSENAMTTQSLARYQRMKAAFPHTTVAPQLNFLNGSPPDVGLLVAGAAAAGCGISWPDTIGAYPTHNSWAQQFYIGQQYNGSAFVPGGKDLRGNAPCIGWVQQPDYAQSTATDILNSMQQLAAGIDVWTFVTGGNGDWTTKVLPMLKATALANTACPLSYNGACV